MNKTPSILVDTGFEVDQNGDLEQLLIPQVVNNVTAPRSVVFGGSAINWVPSTISALQEIEGTNIESLPDSNILQGFTELLSVNFPKLKVITCSTGGRGQFKGCAKLATVTMPLVETITCTALNEGGTFNGCTSLTSINLPELTYLNNNLPNGSGYGGSFRNCTALATVNFPKLSECLSGTYNGRGAFTDCTGLINVTFGSVGHPVTTIGAYTFHGCTQSGLTITIYTNGGAALSGSPWGATNATIVYEEA